MKTQHKYNAWKAKSNGEPIEGTDRILVIKCKECQIYSIQSCQQIYKKYIDSKTSIHNLRHSCFTNLLESGTDIKVISNIAGHSNVKTTEIYTHVSTNILNKVKLPI